MKKYFAYIIGCMLLMPAVCPGQSDKWTLILDYGLQAHDKRLFDFPPFPAARILEQQQETFGTHQFGIRIEKEIARKGKLHFHVGGGVSTELATFSRPFDQSYGFDAKLSAPSTNRYFKYLLQFPVTTRYMATESLGFSLNLLPQFNFLTRAGHTMSNRTYSWWEFDIYALELNPGVEYNLSRFVFTVRYRAFLVKKIDKIIFNNFTVMDSRTDQTFETYNPFKLWLSVGYKLGGNQ